MYCVMNSYLVRKSFKEDGVKVGLVAICLWLARLVISGIFIFRTQH